MGGWTNRALLEETGRKLKSTLGIPRITEKTRCHGSSVRHVYNPMIQGYQPRAVVGHVARYQGSRFGAQGRSRMIQVVVPPSRPQQSQTVCASNIVIVSKYVAGGCSFQMQTDYWNILTNRIHDSFSSQSTTSIWEILCLSA